MTRGRARVHLATAQHGPLSRASCGWIDVDCETDVSRVTCKACLKRLAENRTTARERRRSGTSSVDVERELAEAFRSTLAPTADSSPRITAQLWAASCRGAEHRRCGECEICAWERDAQLWAAVSPWNRVHVLARPENAPRWPSLPAALFALVEWERHDRSAPSALGGILDRIRRGDAGGAQSTRTEDPLQRRAGELVRVRQALDLAYPEGAHAVPATRLKAILLLRTPGMVADPPGYEELAATYHVAVGELKALVRNGRRVVTEELSARGIIPPPRPSHRHALTTASVRFEEEGVHS